MTTTQITYKGFTAEQYRQKAAESRARVQESWQRSDTDGFMSQWAGDLTARMYELQAKILEEGGTAEFPALFDLHGNLIAAKLVSVYDSFKFSHVSKWAILSSDDPDSEIVKWVKLSEAQNDEVRVKNNAKKGYYEGVVIAPAAADMAGASKTSVYITTKRIDGGFSRDVQIVDSGQLPEVRKLRRQTREDVLRDYEEYDRPVDIFDLEDPEDVRELEISRNDSKRTGSTQKSSNKINKKPRTKSAKRDESKPAASSRAASTSHADCKHESTKSARAKCRRLRQQLDSPSVPDEVKTSVRKRASK